MPRPCLNTLVTLMLGLAPDGVKVSHKFFITLHGFPTATVFDGISLTTTEPAPMVTLSPMVTPGRMVTLPPIHTL